MTNKLRPKNELLRGFLTWGAHRCPRNSNAFILSILPNHFHMLKTLLWGALLEANSLGQILKFAGHFLEFGRQYFFPKLESTQRTFTRYISGCQGLSYWDRLKKLGLMSLQRRRERYVILHLWKIWQVAVPNDLDIQFYDHTRLGTRCKIPAIKRNSFAFRGPKLWNAVPKNIKCAPSFEVFKSKLTSHLMSIIPDLPPVPGYTSPNSNSILDWKAGGLQQVA